MGCLLSSMGWEKIPQGYCLPVSSSAVQNAWQFSSLLSDNDDFAFYLFYYICYCTYGFEY
jgi:hypothetical protein